MKKLIVCALSLVFILCCFGGCAEKAPVETAAPETAAPARLDMAAVEAEIDSMQLTDFTPSDEPTDYVKLTVSDYGELVLRLRPDVAPISAENFKALVSQGFYDGLTFHRVYPGFMIQGGDPDGNGTGGSTPIKGEFSSNGVQNNLRHLRGVLSMARQGGNNDSGSCQFFIMDSTNSSLDGDYAAFGYVVAGLSTVDAICDVSLQDNGIGEISSPVTPVVITSATFVAPAAG